MVGRPAELQLTMHIVYLGHFDRSWTTETHLARELEGLGHTVDRMPEPVAASRATLAELEARARGGGADLVLWTRVHPLPAEATALWRRLEADGIATASYHLDLYYGINRRAGAPSLADPFWSTGTVFTADGDHGSAEKFAAAGINHRWMPPAVVSDEAVPGTPRRHFARAPVVFVGQPSVSYPSEWPWRGQLTGWLRATYRDRFAQWPRQRPVRDRDLNDLYASVTVVVGDSLCPPGHGRYWSDRLTETIGRGGFLIFPWIDGIEDQGFVDGVHLRFYRYGDTAGLKELIDHYLSHPDEARAIANQGQAFVAGHHTYRHRMAAMLDQLGLSDRAAA